ncbi:MAG TPA: GTP pyrophosphokinase [Syntrophaceae bacterium]|jgi:(p)ppGpp synthase/HD superfamily hydrolase|nr:GTP pyrophosphokinase [Syntrophaceae bacterium]
MSTLERAIAIACEAHEGSIDKAGAPYILHPLRVMMHMDSKHERIVAVMHDVVEDNEQWTLRRLQEEGFEQDIVDAIDALTKRDGETYMEFIRRVSRNIIGRKVKIADLEDNMNIMRIGNLTEKDTQRIDKYHRAWMELQKDLNFD